MSAHYHWKSQSSKTEALCNASNGDVCCGESEGPLWILLLCFCAAGGGGRAAVFLLLFWVLPHQATPPPVSPWPLPREGLKWFFSLRVLRVGGTRGVYCEKGRMCPSPPSTQWLVLYRRAGCSVKLNECALPPPTGPVGPSLSALKRFPPRVGEATERAPENTQCS